MLVYQQLFRLFRFFRLREKGLCFLGGRVKGVGACGLGVGMCGWVGNKRKKRKKRNEKHKTIDTQRFGVFRFYSVFHSVFRSVFRLVVR